MMGVVRGKSDILIISCISLRRAFRFRFNVLEIILNDINILGVLVSDLIGQRRGQPRSDGRSNPHFATYQFSLPRSERSLFFQKHLLELRRCPHLNVTRAQPLLTTVPLLVAPNLLV